MKRHGFLKFATSGFLGAAYAMSSLHLFAETPPAAKEPASKNERVCVIDLPTALRLAGAQNLDIQLAIEKLAEAHAGEESAIERFFPWVSPGVTYRSHDNLIQDVAGNVIPVEKQSYAPGATIIAQTDIGDAIFKTLEAHQLAKAAGHAFDAQRQNAILAAAGGYFDLSAAHGLVEVARETLRVSSGYAGEIERAVKIGIAFKGDALRVKVQQQRDEIVLRRAEEKARLASAKLSQILHLDPTIDLTPRDSRPVPLSFVSTQQPLSDLVTQALFARPEMKQSAALIDAARQAKNGAIYGPLIPSIGGQAFLGGLGGGNKNSTRSLGESEDYVASLSWRIGPGGLFDFGNIHAKQSRLRSANLTNEKVRDQIAQEVVVSRTRVLSLGDQLTIARQSLNNAQETLRLDQERKEFGVGAVLETIFAEQELSRARADYLATVADYNKAQYDLLKALGKLDSVHTTPIGIQSK